MIGSAGTGAGFGGLVAYLLRERGDEGQERVAWVASRNLVTRDPELAPAEMRATASQNHRVEKPVYHLSLNAPPDEHLSREQWEQVADRVLRDLGLEDHQVLMVAHRDRDHEHVHLAINRVHPETLRTWSNSHDYARIERSLRHIERDLKLREVPGHHHRLAGQEAPARDRGLTSGETQQTRRTGEEPWAEQMRFRLYNDFKEAESWPDLERRLAANRVHLEKRGRGLVVTDGERQVKASRIHRGRSLAKLEKRFGMTYDDWRGRVGGLRRAVTETERVETARSELTRERSRLLGELREGRSQAEPLGRLAAEQREIRGRLGGQLAAIYRPEGLPAARRALDELTQTAGYRAAAEALRREPGRFGTLSGRGAGPVADVARREAVATVPRAAESLEQIGGVRRQIARTLERKLSGAPQARSPAHQRWEEARAQVEALLPRVFRPEAVPRVRRTLETARDPQRTAARLASRPERFGPLLGAGRGGFETAARREARQQVPALAAAVREAGAAGRALVRPGLLAQGRIQRRTARDFRRADRALRRLPPRTQALGRLARAAERVGLKALNHVLPLPPQLALVRLALRTAASISRGMEREEGRGMGQ